MYSGSMAGCASDWDSFKKVPGMTAPPMNVGTSRVALNKAANGFSVHRA